MKGFNSELGASGQLEELGALVSRLTLSVEARDARTAIESAKTQLRAVLL